MPDAYTLYPSHMFTCPNMLSSIQLHKLNKDIHIYPFPYPFRESCFTLLYFDPALERKKL